MAAWDPLALNAFVLYDTEYTSWEGASAGQSFVCPERHLLLLDPFVCKATIDSFVWKRLNIHMREC